MDWTLLTIQVLEALKNIGGSWGMAIILLTIVVRLALIPLSVSQQRSMKKMQELSPKLKQLQQKYKEDPQKLQMKMMEFYKENKFNPLGGCLPLLLQMPIFILLYTTLISPIFLQMAGPESFLFINRLDGTLQTYAGKMDDGTFNVKDKDTFITGKYNVIVKLKNDKTIECTIDDYGKALITKPNPIKPGEKVHFEILPDKIKLHEKAIETDQIVSATIPVVDNNSKEIEHIKFLFNPKNNILEGSADTAPAKSKFNIGVFLLLILFGVTMWFSQKLMTSMSSTANMDPQQKAMQESMTKMMPFMIMAMFVIIPIPAGVLLYMVASNVFQVGQTFAINKYLAFEDSQQKPKTSTNQIIDIESEPKEDSEGNDPILLGTSKQDHTSITQGSKNKLSRKKRKSKAKKKFK